MNNFDINYEWHNEKLPIINGIIYADGSIDWINVDYDGDSRKIVFGNKIHLNDLINKNELYLSSIMVNKKLENPEKQIMVYCGEGGFGGDGFVVVESQTDFKIEWIAFFETANPFENIEVIDDKIIAYNNLDEKWVFDIHNPANISIE